MSPRDRSDTVIEMSGASGPVRVAVHDMPARRVTDGYRWAYGEFGQYLIEEVWEQLPWAQRTGAPWRRRTVCGMCARALPTEVRETPLSMEIRLPDLAPFRIDWQIPIVRCVACGTPHVIPGHEVEFHVSQSLVEAFDSAGVKAG